MDYEEFSGIRKSWRPSFTYKDCILIVEFAHEILDRMMIVRGKFDECFVFRWDLKHLEEFFCCVSIFCNNKIDLFEETDGSECDIFAVADRSRDDVEHRVKTKNKLRALCYVKNIFFNE